MSFSLIIRMLAIAVQKSSVIKKSEKLDRKAQLMSKFLVKKSYFRKRNI